MNEFHNRKVNKVDKTIPSCLGGVVNLFDLSAGASRNKLLTDKPHNDGPSLSWCQSNTISMLSSRPSDHREDKVIVSESQKASSAGKANKMPMKVLIDREMSKEIESKHHPPNVVARLMGLENRPMEKHGSATRGYSQCKFEDSGIKMMHWEKDNSFQEKGLQRQIHTYSVQKEYKDVCEVHQQSPKRKNGREKSSYKGRSFANFDEKKIALVRHMFNEARTLATDEKIRNSEEFQDALEIFASNKNTFVKFLEQPNSLFSHHLHESQCIMPSPETQCITILRPSKMVDEKISASVKSEKVPAPIGLSSSWDKNHPKYAPATGRSNKCDVQPTQIVVLKPNPGKMHDVKATVSPACSPSKRGDGSIDEQLQDDGVQLPREGARETSGDILDDLRHLDETLPSSPFFSTGYVGDESSSEKSENEYKAGNLSDLEVMPASSRNSCDDVNMFCSPYTSSYFSRPSCSSESSVCREAKKRLSERWAMMALNGDNQNQRLAKRNSWTLGEMLALADAKKSMGSGGEFSSVEKEPRNYVPSSKADLAKSMVHSQNLLRSKSLPASSPLFGLWFSGDISDSESGKADTPKEQNNGRSTKSLKGKVSRLFSSRIKKSSKGKDDESESNESADVETLTSSKHDPGRIRKDSSSVKSQLEDCSTNSIQGLSDMSSDFTGFRLQQGMPSNEEGLPFTNPVNGIEGDSKVQHSPISVLEPPFGVDDDTSPNLSGQAEQNLSRNLPPSKSNLIDKSPPIGSVSRTLSWDDSCLGRDAPFSATPLRVCECELIGGGHWAGFVRTLLSVAGLESDNSGGAIFTRLHSPESPLDPSLREKYANLDDKELLKEAKQRQLRSSRYLVFDSVNAALLEIGSNDADSITGFMPHYGRLGDGGAGSMADRVWRRITEWVCEEAESVPAESPEHSSLVAEGVVRKEVGKGWAEHVRMEMNNLGGEIEGALLEELVEEAVLVLTGRLQPGSLKYFAYLI